MDELTGETSDKWHGTVGGYTNHHCRCAACTKAHTTRVRFYKREQVKKAREIGLPDGDNKHGSEYAYQYLCRCTICKAAHAKYVRDQRARKGTGTLIL